jgi:uncharacterized protein (DUF2164 family)
VKILKKYRRKGMNYLLMHKNIQAAELVIDEGLFAVTRISKVLNREHMPAGTYKPNGEIDRTELNDWFFERGIPGGRAEIKEAMEILNLRDVKELLLKSHGLSLTDQYWFQKTSETLDWKDINYFENEFSEDVGNALFGIHDRRGHTDYESPDNTTNGNLKKRRAVSGGRRILIKAGQGRDYQEPYNEVIASYIMNKIGINHVHCKIGWENDKPYSICENFIDSGTEFISAAHVRNLLKKRNDESDHEHIVRIYEKNGLDTARQDIDKMLVLDYIIGNTDRHYNNFGIIRDAETLKWIKPVPIYDSEASLRKQEIRINPLNDIASKPFRKRHSEQIRLVKNYEWLNFSNLRDINGEIYTIPESNASPGKSRKQAMCRGIDTRIDTVKTISKTITQGINRNIDRKWKSNNTEYER